MQRVRALILAVLAAGTFGGCARWRGVEVEPDDDLDPAYAAIARATAMNRAMVESGTDALPDGFMRFLTVTDERISLRRVFRRGIAIALRGLTMQVDPQTGAVQTIRLMGRRP
jgi:hypothetical protein